MKNEVLRKRIIKQYEAYYSMPTKLAEYMEDKTPTTQHTGLVSWVELPADSEMYKQGILVGREVM